MAICILTCSVKDKTVRLHSFSVEKVLQRVSNRLSRCKVFSIGKKKL